MSLDSRNNKVIQWIRSRTLRRISRQRFKTIWSAIYDLQPLWIEYQLIEQRITTAIYRNRSFMDRDSYFLVYLLVKRISGIRASPLPDKTNKQQLHKEKESGWNFFNSWINHSIFLSALKASSTSVLSFIIIFNSSLNLCWLFVINDDILPVFYITEWLNKELLILL